MQARLEKELEGIPLGSSVKMLETRVEYLLSFGTDVPSVRVPMADLLLTCNVEDCGQRAAYDDPAPWCAVHWRAWMDSSPSEDSAKWDRYRKPETWRIQRRSDGAEGKYVGRKVVVRVFFEPMRLAFDADFEDLRVPCEAHACTQRATIWNPFYACASHFERWLKGADDVFPPSSWS